MWAIEKPNYKTTLYSIILYTNMTLAMVEKSGSATELLGLNITRQVVDLIFPTRFVFVENHVLLSVRSPRTL